MPSSFDKIVSAEGRKEWRTHWPVVVTAMLGFAVASLHLHTTGVMIAPLEKEFGWSRTQITSGLLIISMLSLPFSPFVGKAIDHFGPRRIALWGLTAYCLALASLSQAQQAYWTWWVLWMFLAFGYLFVTPTVWMAAITSLFNASRGLAIAVTLSSAAILSLGAPFITYILIENFGWRLAYTLWAAGAATLALPLLYFFFSSAKDVERTTAKSGSAKRANEKSLPFRDSVRSPTFIRLAAVGFIMSLVFIGLVVNIVPILTLSGIHPASAAAAAGVVGISQLIGRLSGGALLDHFNARHVGAFVMIFPIISCLLLILSAGSVSIAIFAILILGLSIGAELDVLAYLSSRSFGSQHFGSLFGTIIGLTTVGTGLGPILSSIVYDLTGSYELVLLAVIPLCLLSGYALLSVGPYPVFAEEVVEARA